MQMMEFKLKLPVIVETEGEALQEIRAADSIVGKEFLSRPDFDKVSRVTSGTLIRKFGSWQELLHKAGLGSKYNGQSITDKLRRHENRYLKDEEILDELKRIASLLKTNTLTRNDIRNNSDRIADTIVVNRFGSLKKGLELAGLKSSANYRERIEDIKYLENILSVWTFHGRQPAANEMNVRPSSISKNAYLNRFGSWRQALQAFIDFANSDSHEQFDEKQDVAVPVMDSTTRTKSRPQDKRGIALGLRYKILSSANFKCNRCGNSPALDRNCKLHVDHIVPFSKGGKTAVDNLQALCDKCNLGKSNNYNE
jgi:hypothetical protein